MTDIVMKAENIGKKYIIGHQAERVGYTALRDVLMQNARTLWSKTKDLATGKNIIQGDTMEEVWALKDVSFERFEQRFISEQWSFPPIFSSIAFRFRPINRFRIS